MGNPKLDEMYTIVKEMYDLKPTYRKYNAEFHFRFGEVTGWYSSTIEKRVVLLDFKTTKDERIYKPGIANLGAEIAKCVSRDLIKTLKVFQIASNRFDRLSIYVEVGYEPEARHKKRLREKYEDQNPAKKSKRD